MSGDRELKVKILGDSSGAQRAFSDVAAGGEGLSSKFKGIALALGSAFAIDKVVDFGKGAIGVAADFQQTTIAFNTMLGSGEKASAFLSKLRDFAAKTPFEFPELATAASSLVSVGVSAEDVIPIMTSLGNATAGMGTGQEGIKRATVALQQMSAAGRITGEDLNQLRDAGIPVFDLLAAATGKTKEQVAALAQTGKLGKKELNQLFEALKQGKGLEKFNGLMDAQSKTLNGVISTLKDTLSNIAIDFVTPYLPAMTNALQSFADLIQNKFVPALHTMVSGIGEAFDMFMGGWENPEATFGASVGTIEKLFIGLGETANIVFTNTKQAIEAFVNAFVAGDGQITSSGLNGFFEALGLAFREVVDAGGELLKFYADHQKAVNDAVVVIGSFVLAIKSVQAVNDAAGAINGFVGSVKSIPENTKKGTEEIRKLASGIQSIGSKTVKIVQSGAEDAALKVLYLRDAIGELKDKVVNLKVNTDEEGGVGDSAKKSAGSFVSGFAGGIATKLGPALAGIGIAIFELIGGWIPTLIVLGALLVGALIIKFREKIGDFFSKLGDEVSDLVGDLKDVLSSKGEDLLAGLMQGVEDKFQDVTDWFTDLPNKIAYAIGYVGGTLVKIGAGLIIGMYVGITTAFKEVNDFFVALPQAVIDFIGDVASTLYKKGSDLVSGAYNGIKDIWNNDVAPFFTNLAGSVVNFVGDVARTLYNKGKDLLSGLKGGVIDAWNDPVKFFKELPGNIVGFVGDVGRLLYSKGSDIVHGLADGVGAVYDTVVSKFRDYRKNITDGFGNAISFLEQAGKDVIQGLLNGIGKLYNSVTEKMKSLGGSIIQGFKDGAGIKSPSKYMHESGVFLMQGLANGIDAAKSLVASSMGDVSSMVLDPLNGVSVGISGSGGLGGSSVVNNYNVNAPGAYAEPITEQGLTLLLRRTEMNQASYYANA